MRWAAFASLLSVAAAALAQDDPAAALRRARAAAAAANLRSTRLEAQAAAAAGRAERAKQEAVAIAARVQAAEADITLAEARLALIERLRQQQRSRLAARQGSIVRLTAALETMARRPTAIALVRPGATGDAIHVRALLDTVLPAVRRRTVALRQELARAKRLRSQADTALAALRSAQNRLRDQRFALLQLEGRERLQSRSLNASAMMESERALALGEQARDLADLMDTLEAEADVRSRLSSLPGPLLRPAVPGRTPAPAALPPGRPRPAPVYRLPVAGALVNGFGELADSGVRSRGVTIAARGGAQVVAPAAGRVSYAGPFGRYDVIAIIDHGGGWTTLVTGLGQTSVAVGDTLRRGSPIGTAAGGRGGVMVELRRHGRPVDVARLAAPI
jgi:murein hydrolase activator